MSIGSLLWSIRSERLTLKSIAPFKTDVVMSSCMFLILSGLLYQGITNLPKENDENSTADRSYLIKKHNV